MALVCGTWRSQQMAIFLLLLQLKFKEVLLREKNKARLAPGSVQLYSEAVRSKGVLLGGGRENGGQVQTYF